MKKYPVYKDSGVEWIEEIPEQWSIIRADAIFDLKKNLIKKDDLNSHSVFHYSIPAVQEFGTGLIEEGQSIDSDKFIVDGDEILFSKLNPRKETITITEKKEILSVASTEFLVLQPKAIYLKFGYYLFKSNTVKERISSTVQSATKSHQRANPSDIFKLWIQTPSIPEQYKIATYLDHKTRQIDELITIKQKLIELLKEERTALINCTVSKGLNLNVPMKDSGIEGLGEIPEHWVCNKLKSLGLIRYGLGQPPKSMENGLPLIRATNIQRGEIVKKDMLYVNPDELPMGKNPILKKGEIIVVRSGAYTGDSAIIPAEYEGAVAGYDMVFTPVKSYPEFISFCFLSNYVLKNQLIPSSSRAAQPHLNAEELGSTIIACPPHKEQVIISTYLLNKQEKFEATVMKIQKEIELLSEYKTSLINEAVTGKIDVRDYHITNA